MPLDTSIPLQVRRVQLEKPEDIRLRSLTLQGAERQNAEAMRSDQERRTIADLYRKSLGENGSVDSAAFSRGLAESGLGDRIPAYQKSQLDLEKATTEAGSSKFKLAKDRLDALNGAVSSLLALPSVTHQDVIAKVGSLVDAGLIPPEQGAKMVRDLPSEDRLRPFLLQQGLQVADASKRLESLLPKYDEQDKGGSINEGTINPLTGQRTPGVDVQKTLTPGEVQGAENIRTMAGAGVTYQTNANGDIIALPTKPGAGGITPRPVTDPNGAPTSGRGLNDAQSKALLFGSRARDSAKIMADLETQGTLTPSLVKQGVSKVPLVGGLLEMGANKVTASPGEQQLEQAQRDFVNAVLRRESGAVISPSEFENAAKQYFPAIGDSPEVIQQKAQNRELAIQGLLAEVPEGKRGSISGQQPAETAAQRAKRLGL